MMIEADDRSLGLIYISARRDVGHLGEPLLAPVAAFETSTGEPGSSSSLPRLRVAQTPLLLFHDSVRHALLIRIPLMHSCLQFIFTPSILRPVTPLVADQSAQDAPSMPKLDNTLHMTLLPSTH